MGAIRAFGVARLRRVGLCTLGAVGISPTPVSPNAEVRLGGEAGGDYRMKVTSWAEIPFRTVVRQQYDFSCGSAAVATLLTYHYDPTDCGAGCVCRDVASRRSGRDPEGRFLDVDMKTYLESLGYEAEGFRMGIDDLHGLSRPMIVLLEINGFKHFTVVKGLRGNRILLGDPALGLTEYELPDFDAMWNNIALIITGSENGPLPEFDRDSDWGPWSVAPIEDGTEPLPVSALTSHLPPVYQIASQFLINVQAGD